MADNLVGTSSKPKIAAVMGTQTGSGGTGVHGESTSGAGVSAHSKSSVGVDAKSDSGPAALRAVHAGEGPGVLGRALNNGVHGHSTGTKGFAGVFGESTGGPGVSAHSTDSVGVDAKSDNGPAALRAVHAGEGPGVLAEARNNGVHGRSIGTKGFAGVFGESTGGPGVSAHSAHSVGVDAKTDDGPAAVRAIHAGGGVAGLFDGNVLVTRDLVVNGDVKLAGADLAEQFEVVGSAVDPGSVVVLAGDDRVTVSNEAYDRRVAGVVSGAGSYRPGIVLDRRPDDGRCPLALSGKVWCKVDATDAPIEVGDMLTSSAVPGHAMRASDPARAFGAIIGKALERLESGRGLVPVLVALH
jgi:hypothetical protein